MPSCLASENADHARRPRLETSSVKLLHIGMMSWGERINNDLVDTYLCRQLYCYANSTHGYNPALYRVPSPLIGASLFTVAVLPELAPDGIHSSVCW